MRNENNSEHNPNHRRIIILGTISHHQEGRRSVVVVFWCGDRPSFQAGRSHTGQGQTELRLGNRMGWRSVVDVLLLGDRPSFQAGRSHVEQGQTEKYSTALGRAGAARI